jgi:hypothetical protein
MQYTPRNAIRTTLATLTILAATIPSLAQETYSTWAQHKFVGVNTSPNGGGAGIPTSITNFPVLIRLDATNFNTGFAQSVGRGADLRFTKLGDALRLPHQVERWDSAAKQAEIWVRLDTVYANSMTSFRMHWGKSGVADSSNGGQVFDTTQGFAAVYHLGETASDSARDATKNRFHGAPANAPGSIAGIVGLARSFDGTSQHFEVPNSASGKLNYPLDGIYTISSWAYIDPNSSAVDRVIAAKHDNQYALKISTDSRWQFFEYDGTWTIAGQSYELGRWTHLTGVLNGRDTYLYVDGYEAQSNLDCCSGGGSRNETINFFIGRAGESARRWWWGNVDELRVASVARSPEWTLLEYQNQKPGATMTVLADTLPVVSIAAAHSVGPNARTGKVEFAANGIRFQMFGMDPATQVRFEVVTMDGRVLWNRIESSRNGVAQTVWRTETKGSASGVYTVRMSVLDADGRTLRTESVRFSAAR